MTARFTAQMRLTHRYRDGWSHLDSYSDMGFTLRVVQGKVREDGEDICEPKSWYYHVTTSVPVTLAQIRSAASALFSLGSCRHEHDCCGCTTTSASTHRIFPRSAEEPTGFSRAQDGSMLNRRARGRARRERHRHWVVPMRSYRNF